ncbi:MAG TPA: hypothetical protein VNS58_29500, partial [Puia sp.]|nr:hypothetical protein [Puia sp.]
MKNPWTLFLTALFTLPGIFSSAAPAATETEVLSASELSSAGSAEPPVTYAIIGNDTIYSAQTICYNTTPVALTGTTPTGGIGSYTYKWQTSTTSATTGYSIIGGATAQGYAPGALTATHWYRRIVTSGVVTDTTAAIQITVTPVIVHTSNTITAAQTICYNTAPATLAGSIPTGGDGINYTYTWQSSPDNTTWTLISGATGQNYTPPVLTASTYYRRITSSGNCTDITTSIKITVSPVITNNTIKTDQSICSGQAPLGLTGLTPAGGSGTYVYSWQSSTISATVGFATASGTATGINYAPAALTQTTWFRRVVTSGGCSDTSGTTQITVVSSAPGNPTVYGNNVWNAYGYSDNSFTTYAGYYTEPSLSFITTSRYTTAQSPSSASGYQGCLIATTNFSVSFKRTNFTPADYQIDLTAVDDIATIFVNGLQVYTHSCCVATTAPVNNVWTGYLGASDQVEIRWVQITAASILGVNFTAVTPAALIPGTTGSNQSVCYGDPVSAGFTNTASATSGCTLTGYQWQNSVDSITWTNIGGATATTYTVPTAMTQTTWYRRVVTDACLNTAVTVPVKVLVNVIPPGDPTVFGDNVWNAYAYTFPSSNTNFSAASYKGYYTEPSLSFNSTSRWANGGSPSIASGYQGCYVAPTYNWMVYKRTDFTPGIYQIDIPGHDDWCYVYLNGTLIFQHLGCCDSHTNIWTGPLGASDQIEFRVEQFAGGSYGAISLTPVTPTALTAGTITPSQTICAGNTPPTPMTQAAAPTGGCSIQSYQWESSTDNGTTWTPISAATASSYTVTNSVYTQTLYHRIVYDVCGNSATSLPDTVYMNNSAPGNPTVFGNNTWNVYCFQDVNYSIYSGYYTEPLLTFNTTNRYPSTATPSSASGYLGCQLINTYYSVSMKRTGFAAGTYQIDVTADDDYTSVYINGTLVSSLTYPTIQNNIWTGPLGPSDQVEIRWRNNAGPGQTGIRFTTVTPIPLLAGTIAASNPNLCTGDVPIVNNTTLASGGCYTSYFWQSSTDGGATWTTIAGYTGYTDISYTGTVSPTVPTQFRRVAFDVCNDTAYSNAVTFTPGAGAVGNPSVFGNGAWNVYCYNASGAAFSTATYMGYYTEPLLSFNSVNRWGTNSPPSMASGYQGCQVDQVNHWVSYRQTNFTPATYQLDIPTHDDDVYVYINGVLVFTHVGCCDSHTNIWTGALGATDQVEYRWRQNYGASQGALNLTVVTPPVSLTPGVIGASQTICNNTAPAAFTSTSAGVSNCYVYYQWQSQTNCSGAFSSISGATGLTYTSGALTSPTCFRRMATDACGNTAYSDTVTVSIYSTAVTPGTISAPQTICSGATPAAITSASLPTGGDGNYIYQWQSSPDGIAWSNIASATTAGYAPPALTVSTYYRRNVSACAAASTASSAALLITVNQPPVITVPPANAVACSGGNTSISVTATGTSLTYQWQVNTGSTWTNVSNGALYSGVTTATLSLTGVTVSMNGYQYHVIITGVCTPVLTSTAVTLTTGTAPGISSQPANLTTCVGSNAGFNVTASGSGLVYQWQQKIGAAAWTNLSDGGVYSGTATSALVLTAVPASMNNYQYQCIVTSSCAGTVTSSPATLTVVAAISNAITASQNICTGINAATLSGPASGSYTYQWQSSTVSATAGFITASGTSTAYNFNPNPVSTTTYYRRLVSNPGCSSTSNAVTITVNPTAISISAQPANQAICAGGTAVYSVTASGPGTLTYQWYQYNGSTWSALSDGGMYSGSATASLTITGATSAMNNYRYYVQIFASGCSTSSLNSNSAILTTNNAPVITYSNPDVTACSGNNINLSVTATGIGLTYQWQLNTGSGWNNLSNSGGYSNVTASPLTITGVNVAMSGNQYRCVVSGSCAPGTATSGTTNLTVNPPVSGNSVSSSQTLCAGTPVPFTVTTPTGGDGSYTYQWYQNTGSGYTAISGAISLNYSTGPLAQTTSFIRNVYDATCATNSSIAVTITINPPTTTGDPSNTTVCAGTNATFTVAATGTGLGYQWQVNTGSGFNNISNGVQYTGVTTATLTVLTPAYALNGYQYRCVVSGNCSPASITSNFATLTVNPIATITGQPVNVNSCAGSTVTYSVTATGTGLTYQWQEKVSSGSFTNIIDGGIYSGSATSVLTLSGITVSMNTNQYRCIITYGTCPVNSSTASLTVSGQPNLVIINPAFVCAPSTVDITAASVTTGSNFAGGTLTYWKNAANTVTLSNPSSISTSGTYYIRANTSSVCYDSKPVTVTINPKPTVLISNPSPICVPNTVDITTAAVTAGSSSGLTYTYYTDAATTTSLSNPTAIAASGTYYIKGTAATGCNTIVPVTVVVNVLPTATIAYSGSPYCATGTAAITQTGQGGGTYSSTSGLSINSSTGAINLAASTASTYTVTYTFSNGTCSNTTTTTITINALPTAVISYTGIPYCATGTAAITQTGQGGGTYSSTSGLSINSSTGAINLAASTASTYTVTYSFTSGGCSNTTTTTITINALPTATIAYSGSPYCATGTASVTQTGPTGGTYNSTAGLVINATTGDIDLIASTAGTYTVTYNFSNGTCSNSTTTTITIKALPTAAISYPGTPYCATGTASVTQTGTAGGTYASAAGLSLNSSTGVVNLAASTTGIYTITYSFSNGTCSNTTTTTITINALPTATIAYAGAPYCATGTASVTQTGQIGGTYSSTAGLVINASTGAVDLVASTAGTYTVTYSFSNGTCPNTTTTTITINALPTATIVYSGTPYCATGTASVTQTGQTGGTYSSTAGLVINASTGAVDLVASTAGTYTVTYSFSNGTCSNTTTTIITINALPTAVISYTGSPYCAMGTASVTQTGQTGGTYSSTAGLVINASTGVVDLVTSTAGTYIVTYSFSNGTCSNTTTTAITINVLPTAVISYTGSPYCATGTASVTQTGQAGGTYSSTAGLVINASTGAVDLVASTAGTYTVTYNFSNGTCSNTTTTIITINALPTAVISYTGSPYCATGTASVTQTGQAGGTYSSTAGLVINASTGAVDLVASTAGTYTVTYNFSNGTCSNTTTTNITINALPTAAIAYTGSPYCATGTASVTQTGQTGGTYSSTTGLVINSSTGAINLATSTAGIYTVTYSFSNGTCPNTTTTTITINALPTATIIYSGTPYCATGTASVTQTGQTGGVYSSTAGLVINASTGAVDLVASTAGTYIVTYSFSNGTCSNTTTTTITINALPTAIISYTGSPYCATGTASVTQTGQAGGTYSSTAGLVINASTGAVDLVASTAGTYTVTYSF